MSKRMIKLGDIATYINGYAFKPEDRGESGLPIIRIQDLTGNTYNLGFYNGDYPMKIEINNGDILISWSASLGVYVWNKEKALLNQHIFKVVFNKVDIDKKYFVYAVRQKLVEMERKTHGATMKHITKKDFDTTLIPYPPIEEQTRISEVLDKIEGLIEARKQEQELLDISVKSRFIELFGDMFLNSKGWPESRLDSVADIVSGITKGRKVKSVNVTEVPYMAVSNVKDGYIDWTTVKTIEATSQEIEQYRLMPDDVLMTEGGDPDKVGRGAIIKKPLDNCIHQNHIFRVRLDESVILPGFFAEYLQHQRSKRYFLGCAKQTTGIASINMKQLRALPVLVPPLSDQEQFVSFVTKVDKSKLSDLLPWKNYSHYLIA